MRTSNFSPLSVPPATVRLVAVHPASTGLILVSMILFGLIASAEDMHPITIDGQFGDWVDVPSYFDPVDDTHDTDTHQPDLVPAYVQHEDVDLVEFKLTHDAENLYAYFRATGVIGRTQHESAGRPGRYYVIVTIDVDNDYSTGYWLHEGGYHPTSPGYDMNMEVEFFNGAFNTGHYLNHGCLNESEFFAAQTDQANGIVDVRPGTYKWYTQWVWWDTPQNNPGEIILPDGSSTIIWVEDKGPVYQGIIRIALSPDGHEAEMIAPFRGFMKYPDGTPIIALGKTINVSFSLEASGELAAGGTWASDTAEPITGYYLGSQMAPAKYVLTTSVEGNGSMEPAPGVHTFNEGTVVPVSATAFGGWYFDHWEGGLTGRQNPAGVLMDEPKAVTAVFIKGRGPEDIDHNGAFDAVDVQLVINAALKLPVEFDCDVNRDGAVDAIDVQQTINAVLRSR
ncbi:MAG TPA: hypothetical protein PLD73_12305 [Candidatus Hydrogenedentes bacterium]|nr:hypothetical protein [Candidatus Hydrogenedentota bacterium]